LTHLRRGATERVKVNSCGRNASRDREIQSSQGVSKVSSDTQLQSSVLAELKWRPSIDAAHIGVSAENGIVTLSGQVHNYTEKLAAENAAKDVFGVKGIANDIKVEPDGSLVQSDKDIAAAAVGALKWDFEVPKERIKVLVKDGWVSLDGTVDWQYQRDAAERCVKYLRGVVGVTNSIVIKPTAKWLDVTTQIEDAFRRNADLDARRIFVSTSNGTVTLTGTVRNWSERDAAISGAWAAPGVTWVKDELVISP
jgi:osmotically-inducible protein OsmY